MKCLFYTVHLHQDSQTNQNPTVVKTSLQFDDQVDVLINDKDIFLTKKKKENEKKGCEIGGQHFEFII